MGADPEQSEQSMVEQETTAAQDGAPAQNGV